MEIVVVEVGLGEMAVIRALNSLEFISARTPFATMIMLVLVALSVVMRFS
jgi:hypothetical protein